jgi:hypothetical protein
MSRKVVLLFLALLLPGLVFVFLRFFGKNQFEVPVYHQDSLAAPAYCHAPVSLPYVLPDSVAPVRAGQVGIVSRGDYARMEMARLSQEFDTTEYVFRAVPETPEWGCVLVLELPWNTVLLDDRGRIRGYYAIGTRDEMDRLMLEMKILLNKY